MVTHAQWLVCYHNTPWSVTPLKLNTAWVFFFKTVCMGIGTVPHVISDIMLKNRTAVFYSH